MSYDLSDKELANLATEYIFAARDLREAKVAMENAKALAKMAEESIIRLAPTLKESVQPICGSATRTNRRVFHTRVALPNEVLVIDYDHGLHQATINLEKIS